MQVSLVLELFFLSLKKDLYLETLEDQSIVQVGDSSERCPCGLFKCKHPVSERLKQSGQWKSWHYL